MTWKEMLLNVWVWFHGLLGAIIGGGATAVSMLVIDPATFNFQAGLDNMIKVAVVSGIINAAIYLKGSPMPKIQANAAANKLLPK